jgi:hypothetical protein
MSALGQKQTYAVQKSMSALPLKADMCGATRGVRFGPIADMLTIRSPLRRRGRPDRIVNEPALLFLLALNVLHITILNFDAVALTEGTPPSAFVSGLVLVLGASAGAFLFMILLRSHGLRKKSCPLYPPKADMCGARTHVRFGPKADIVNLSR